MTETPEPRRFYLVWSPQGGPPVVRYPSFYAARSAAIRLSNKLPGQDFFVLASCWGKLGAPADGAGPVDSAPPTPDPEASPRSPD
jgi:hypothetical protein